MRQPQTWVYTIASVDIKHRIRAARDHVGLTREQLAQELQVTYETVRQWEEGEIAPRRQRFAAIAEVTGVREAWLAGGDGPMMESGSATLSAAEVSRLARMLSLQDRLAVASDILASAQKDAAQ